MNKLTAGIARAILATSTAFAAASVMALAAGPSAAWAQEAGLTAIGSHAEYRIDGLREGVHRGVPVRFLDMTLKNLTSDVTFAATIQKVWWQGRTVGAQVTAWRPDGEPLGMHTQYIRQGQAMAVTYPIPVRDDVGGVTIAYPKPGGGEETQTFTWAELAAAKR